MFATTTRRSMLLGLAMAAGLTLSGAAGAQTEYPTRPVKIIVPFGAGGVADVTIRIVAEKLSDKMGQRFIVENMPGAGGITAARAALSSAPDGHTLTMLTNGTAVSVPLFANLPFDPLTDFVPISTLGTFDFLFVVNANSEYKSFKALIQAAKDKPGDLNVATIAVGSTQHLTSVLFKGEAGADLRHVPFRNTPDALVSLIRNDTHLLIDSQAALKSALEGNQVRALATSGPRRSPAMPDVPTVQEAGISGFDVTSWNALFAPKGTPEPVIQKLNAALKEILAMPDIKARLLDLGIEARSETPAELTQRLRSDIEKWRAVIEKAGIPKQ
ncbi:Bug family tripartite tricarboxylate transporter substrate binding protein [Microvirga arabica]|uniref:Bug family tripartite tricarboxylate transporter substrate binding protein n=1 Tax=Microvirga arabica TaxID=1128671 RepID=A0ABV6YGA6_9HYPH|nr:tripartite tricarboxylate transporter substrate binding protein [Microvirga arabica]MBM1169438.1 tripartite tricarboxylate transporter substrate binding protein [Microvirga arabica]